MKRIQMLKKGALIFTLLFLAVTNSYADLAVIVNKDNPVDTLTINEVRNIFLSRTALFPKSQLKIRALDLSQKSDQYKDFYQAIANMTVIKVSRYRARISFGGKGAIPAILEGSDKLLKTVSENQNAIGYVEITDAMEKQILDKGVKVVLKIETP